MKHRGRSKPGFAQHLHYTLEAVGEISIPVKTDQALCSSRSCSGASPASSCPPGVNTHPTNRPRGQLPPLVNLGRHRESSLKKLSKGKQSNSISLKEFWFFSLEARFRSLSSCPFALKWKIGLYTEVIAGPLVAHGVWCPTSPHPQQRPREPRATALHAGKGQCQPRL